MAVSFPRAFPDSRFIAESFDPETQDVDVPLAGGDGPSVMLGPSRWVGSFRVESLGRTRGGLWSAWLTSLRGGGRYFYGRDSRRPWPLAYTLEQMTTLARGTSGTFNGNATAWSVDATRTALTLTGLPALFRMQPGDYVGFDWSTTKRSLHKVLSDYTGNSGGTGVWDVEPSVPTFVPADATARLLRPDCVMRLIEKPNVSNGDNRAHSISFTARQHLEA